MFLANVFNSEVVNYECEADRSCVVFPEARRLVILVSAMLFEMFLEQFMGYNYCMH